uniref:NADH dehydrogenase [ubiquinone] 1 subunit C1, mitochondrial n=1 Tax=Callorhinchus milii TaxID=7868 RepID=V9LJC1_CALMI
MMMVTVARGLFRSAAVCHMFTRSAFTATKPDYTKPNWLRVGLAFGTSIAIWTLLFKQHDDDVKEYNRLNGIE